MSSRYGQNLHARDAHYDRQRSELYGQASSDRYGSSSSPYGGYSSNGSSDRASSAPPPGALAPGGSYSYYSSSNNPGTAAVGATSYRAATPNRKGQYSAAVMEELESQNEAKVDGLSAKVRMLKDITVAIGDEVRSSSGLIDTINDGFEDTRGKLRSTMKNMLRMARRTGVGWKAWTAFLAVVMLLFVWVWI